MRIRAVAVVITVAAVLMAPPFGTPAPEARPQLPRALIFFNSLCEACKADATRIKAWSVREQGHYALLGVGFMMSDRDSVRFAEQLRWRFPVEGDPAGRIATEYHIWSPTMILLIDGPKITELNYASW